MRSLTARSTALIENRKLRPVPIVRLETYTDRTASTVDEVFYFSDRGCRFDWNGTVVDVEPFLAGIGSLAFEMAHLPGPDDYLRHWDAEMVLQLSNHVRDGGSETLYEVLRALNLETARVLVGYLLLADADSDENMSALDETELVVFFRGEVVQAFDITETQFSVRVRSERLPLIDQLIADDPLTVDPRDLGKPVAYVYGKAKRVPAVGWDVGFATTLAETITDTQTGLVYVSSTAGFPTSGTFQVYINGEKITCNGSATTATQISLTTRGVGSTVAAVHAAGETVLETTNAVSFLVASHQCSAVGNVYVRNPYTGELVLVSNLPGSAAPTVSANDTTTVSGETVASISWTAAGLEALLTELSQQAAVTQQPVVDHPVTVTGRESPSSGTSATRDGNLSTTATATGGGGPNGVFATPPGTITKQVIRVYVTVYDSESIDVKLASGGTEVTIGTITGTGWSTFTVTSGTHLQYNEVRVEEQIGGSAASHEIAEIERDVTYIANDPTIGTPAAIEAASIGYGLEVFADVDGALAPDSFYLASSGTLMESAADVLQHYLRERRPYAELVRGSWDDSPFSSRKVAFDERALGGTWREIVSRVAFEANAQLILDHQDDATYVDLDSPDYSGGAYSWSATVGLNDTIDDFGEAIESGRDADGIFTRWRGLYDLDYSRIAGSAFAEDAWLGLYQVNPTTSDNPDQSTTDVTNAEKAFGAREHTLAPYYTMRDTTALDEAFGYRIAEAIRVGSTARLRGVHWRFGLRVHLGDRVNVQLPWWSSARKCRIIGITHNWDSNLFDLIVVEVT